MQKYMPHAEVERPAGRFNRPDRVIIVAVRLFIRFLANKVKVEFKNTHSGFHVIFYRPPNESISNCEKKKRSPFASPFVQDIGKS